MTPREAKEIRARCRGMASSLVGPHPLDGKSVAEWVAEARAGWPRPIPYNPSPTALKWLAEYGDLEEMEIPR